MSRNILSRRCGGCLPLSGGAASVIGLVIQRSCAIRPRQGSGRREQRQRGHRAFTFDIMRHIGEWAAVLLAVLGGVAIAQKPISEFWPELDVYWTPAEHQRTFLELSSS